MAEPLEDLPLPNLTTRQKAFVREFLVDQNGTQAAVRAGYSVKGASVASAKNLKNSAVRLAINRTLANVEARQGVTSQRILDEYARLALLDPRDFYGENGEILSIDKMPEDARRTLTGIESDPIRGLKLKFASKVAALDSLAKIKGLMTDRISLDNGGLEIHIHLEQQQPAEEPAIDVSPIRDS